MQITAVQVMGEHDIEYTVTAKDAEHVTCTCPSFVYRGGVCKHIAFVAERLGVVTV